MVIKLLPTPHSLGLYDNIYNEGNISRLPDFDGFFLSKRNERYHGIRKNGSLKRKNRHVFLLSDFIITLSLMAFSRSITLSISSLRNLDTNTEANKNYDRAH